MQRLKTCFRESASQVQARELPRANVFCFFERDSLLVGILIFWPLFPDICLWYTSERKIYSFSDLSDIYFWFSDEVFWYADIWNVNFSVIFCTIVFVVYKKSICCCYLLIISTKPQAKCGSTNFICLHVAIWPYDDGKVLKVVSY